MARGSNFYYAGDQQLGAALGATLGKALFGDPEAAAKLQLQRAQMDNYAANAEESRAHAGLYGKQGDGLDIQNNAAKGLPEMFAKMFLPAPAPAAPAAPVDPLAPLPDAAPVAAAPHVTFDPQTFRDGLPALMAALAQAQGDKLDPNALVGGLTAIMGNDEFARRGLIAQGKTPGEDFALTPERADAISARDADEGLRQALSVEGVRSGDRRYATDTQAATSRRGQDIGAATTRRGQDLSHGDRLTALDSKGYDRASAIALGQSLGTVTSTVRNAEHNREVGGVPNSYHLDSRGGRAIDIVRRPGISHAQLVQKYRDAGFTILEDLDEGDHSHIALAGGPGAKGGAQQKSGAPKGPKMLSAASDKMLDAEINAQIGARGWAQTPDAGTRVRIKEAVVQRYQQTGNPAAAVSGVLDEVKRRFDAKQGGGKRTAQADRPPVPGARKAPDGNWYVKQGNGYARVDVTG